MSETENQNLETTTEELEEENQKFQTPQGTFDILPDEHIYYTLIKKVVRYRGRQAGFRRITPVTFEERALFERSVWDSSDIVEKELYTLNSKSGTKDYALRPELTAGIVRSYIQHGMNSLPQPVMLYAFEPVFRHDRPQKGRYRQFFQFDMEAIWECDPGIDAQLIHLGWQILKDLKIEDWVVVKINSLWSGKARKKHLEDLKNYFEGRKRGLCEDCQRRLEKNPLRILDCKNEDCQLLALKAPKIKDYLSDEDEKFHEELLELLEAVGIPFEQDDTLVRGLDYYNKTIFEFVDKTDKSSQNTLIGGGRYDWLVELLGWVEWVWACGFGMWIERVIEKMKKNRIKSPNKDRIDVFVAQLGRIAKVKAFPMIEQLHNLWVHTMWAIGKPSIKGQMRMADKSGAKVCLIMGTIEVRDNKIIFRDMEAGTQEVIPFDQVIPKILKHLESKNIKLDRVWFLEDIYIEEEKEEVSL